MVEPTHDVDYADPDEQEKNLKENKVPFHLFWEK